MTDRLSAWPRAALEHHRPEKSAPNWQAGVSFGSLFGELRGVVDVDGERQFFIAPPTGPQKIMCVFDEGLRTAMVENLFKPVRARGFLHYNGKTPFPYLLNAKELEGQSEPVVHLSDLRGAFPDLSIEPFGLEAL